MRIKQNKGFSILEVLIAFVILVVGLLAATTLIIRSSQINVTAYETEQIAMLANSMIERIRANPDGISNYKTRQKSENSACAGRGASCSVADRAQRDNYWFKGQINDRLNDENADWTLLENDSANILTGVDGKLYQLKITWGEAPKQNVYYVNFVL